MAIELIQVEHERTAAIGSRKPRRLSARVLAMTIVSALSIGVLLWVAPPAQVIRSIADMNPVWLLVAVAFELGSCLSYVVVFRRFFPEPKRAVGRRVAWIAMGAGAVLPGGNFSSAATTGWLLRDHGITLVACLSVAARCFASSPFSGSSSTASPERSSWSESGTALTISSTRGSRSSSR